MEVESEMGHDIPDGVCCTTIARSQGGLVDGFNTCPIHTTKKISSLIFIIRQFIGRVEPSFSKDFSSVYSNHNEMHTALWTYMYWNVHAQRVGRI